MLDNLKITKESEVALLGEAGTFPAANALGINVFTLDPEKEIKLQLEDLILSRKYAIIYVSAKVASESLDIIEAYSDEFVPAIITLPSNDVAFDSLASLKQLVIRAIGIDLVSSIIEQDEIDKK